MTFTERFWSKVQKSDGCWFWLAGKHRSGYGWFSLRRGRSDFAHRVAYTLTRGEIPSGLCVLHACDVRACVRPDHLFVGTKRDNNMDMTEKGRNGSCPGERHPRAKLNVETVRAIRAMRDNGTLNNAHMAAKLGVSHQAVSSVVRELTWRGV